MCSTTSNQFFLCSSSSSLFYNLVKADLLLMLKHSSNLSVLTLQSIGCVSRPHLITEIRQCSFNTICIYMFFFSIFECTYLPQVFNHYFFFRFNHRRKLPALIFEIRFWHELLYVRSRFRQSMLWLNISQSSTGKAIL